MKGVDDWLQFIMSCFEVIKIMAEMGDQWSELTRIVQVEIQPYRVVNVETFCSAEKGAS